MDDGRGGSCRGGNIPSSLPPPSTPAPSSDPLPTVPGLGREKPIPLDAVDTDRAADALTELREAAGGVGGGGLLSPRLLGEGDCGTLSTPPWPAAATAAASRRSRTIRALIRVSTDSSAADCSVARGDGVSGSRLAAAALVVVLEYEYARPIADAPQAPDADMDSEGGSTAPPTLPFDATWV